MTPRKPLQFSKWQILQQFPKQYIPKTLVVEWSAFDEKQVDSFLKKLGTETVIVKPDIWERGVDIRVVEWRDELFSYLNEMKELILIQELIVKDIELGVMYYRFPWETRWEISWVTVKEFTTVLGDGTHSLRELVSKDKRGRRYEKIFEEIHWEKYDEIVPSWEVVQLSKIGNHSKGTKFVDRSEIINNDLVAVFDDLTNYLDEIYYGRFDIKVDSLESLYKGEWIKVLEVNGIQSEPAHMFDPKHTLWYWLRELLNHWKVLTKISKMNVLEKRWVHLSFFDHIFRNQSTSMSIPIIPQEIDSLWLLEDSLRAHCERQMNAYWNIQISRCQFILDHYSGTDWKDIVTFSDVHYTRWKVVLSVDDTLFDIRIIWRSCGQMSGVHNHASQWCVFKVLEWELTEKRYEKNGDKFSLKHAITIEAGRSEYISDDIGYHDLGNSHEDTTAASIHVYSPASHITEFYDIDTH